MPYIKIRSGGRIQPMQPWEWQLSLINQVMGDWDTRSSYIFAKSRQCGASEGLLSILLWLSLIAGSGLVEGVHEGFTSLVISRTQQDAFLLARRMRRMIRSLELKLDSDALSMLAFPNGSSVMFRSGDPDSVGRGIESINAVVLDEFSFYEQQARTMEAIAPGMTSVPNSKLFVISTPNGKSDEFWRLLTTGPLTEDQLERKLEGIRTEVEPPFQYINGNPRLVLLNWREVYDDRKDTFLQDIKAEFNLTEATIRQEYEMEFISESEDFIFPLALVRECTAGQFESEPDPAGLYFAGIDAATSSSSASDYTVCCIIRKVDDQFTVAALYRKRTGSSQEHLSAIAKLLERFMPIDTLVETNGPGGVWLENLAGLNLPTDMKGFITTRPSKEALITRLVLAMESGELTIPDSPITTELLSFRRTRSGKIEASQGEHDDCVIGLALALTAAAY